MKKLKKAFTLVELMVVITVIAILMTIAIVSFTRIQKQARDSKRKAEMRTLQIALQAYFTEFQVYPISETPTLATTALDGLIPTYIPSIPVAPPGATGTNPGYMYVSDISGITYALCTNLETASASAGTTPMWVVSTSKAGEVMDNGVCSAPL